MNKALRLLAVGGLVLCTVGAWAADKKPLAVLSKVSLFYDESIEFRADHQYDQTITLKAKLPHISSTAPRSYKLSRHGTWRLLSVPASDKLTAALPPKARVELKSALVPLPLGETSVQCGDGNPQFAVSDLTFPLAEHGSKCVRCGCGPPRKRPTGSDETQQCGAHQGKSVNEQGKEQ